MLISRTLISISIDFRVKIWYNTYLLARKPTSAAAAARHISPAGEQKSAIALCDGGSGEPHAFVSADTRQKLSSVKIGNILNLFTPLGVLWRISDLVFRVSNYQITFYLI
jgi:hypothetical protein